MLFYALLDRAFPNSFPIKVFAVAFVGTHVPLIAVVIYALIQTGGIAAHLDVLALLLAATLTGCGGTLAGLWALLAPVRRMNGAIESLERGDSIHALPDRHRDEIGALMRLTNLMADSMLRRQQQAQTAAQTDPLTGLPNRRGFDARVPQQAPGAILFLDLDRFKRVNDTYGHAIGDDVLRQAATVISAALRREDVVARFGGEEFVIWLPGATRDTAWTTGERLRLAIAGSVRVAEQPVTASIGLALCAAEDRRETVIARADAALYAAKHRGRNRVVERCEEAGGETFALAPGRSLRAV
ncbi:GGDEF domain-containing protein [Salipiger bermudensis]|uniref:GGDEF domain-containing protein n=1 Tax=Salipiger bermudensis TaxID=344736 RepID=UPI003009E10A